MLLLVLKVRQHKLSVMLETLFKEQLLLSVIRQKP